MEEGGHYYTVYTVSLAVGFADYVARRHAFFCQMPDEIDQLDAANLEFTFLRRYGIGQPAVAPIAGAEIERPIMQTENQWRILIEHTLHALTGRNAQAERRRTAELLRHTRVDDYLRFGLLLHRFGDTYAHAQMDNPRFLYYADPSFSSDSRGHGHARHEHAPDHPWERPRLMNEYVTALYNILLGLAQRPENTVFLRTPRQQRSLAEVRDIFTYAIERTHQYQRDLEGERCWIQHPSHLCSLNENSGPQLYFINSLRHDIFWRFGVIMAQYAPESSETMTWTQFRNLYGQRRGPVENISWDTIVDAVSQINRDVQ